MALSVQDQETRVASDGIWPSGYRLFGNFWLEEPDRHLSQEALNRLRELEPHFRDLEIRLELGKPQRYPESGVLSHPSSAFKLETASFQCDELARFQKTESVLRDPPWRKDELVPPSGDLNWPIAHHLHNPSFTTQNQHNGETADPTNPCIGLIMANTFVKGKTLIYDHLARREILDGLVDYPEHILGCHESWLLKIRKNMLAKVEILYGRHVQQRMLKTCDLERLSLWGKHGGIAVYLEWMSGYPKSPRKLTRLLIFAMHPQLFLFPWGKKFTNMQDDLICIAHHLTGLTYNNRFYQDWHWSFINRFPKLHHYTQQQALARDAFKAVQAAKGLDVSSIKMPPESEILYRPGTWNSNRAVKMILLDGDNNSFLVGSPQPLDTQLFGTSEQNILDNLTGISDSDLSENPKVYLDLATTTTTRQNERKQFGDSHSPQMLGNKKGVGSSSKTRLTEKIIRDPRKPPQIEVLCKKCGRPNTDYDPKWHKQDVNYIAKKRRCEACGKQQTIPQNPAIKYVTYNAVMVRISRVGRPYFRPYLQRLNFDSLQVLKTQDAKTPRRPDSAAAAAAQGSAQNCQETPGRAMDPILVQEAQSETSQRKKRCDQTGAQRHSPRSSPAGATKQSRRETPADQADPADNQATLKPEGKNKPQTNVDKGPFASRHRRKAVMSAVVRVSMWVRNGIEKTRIIHSSAYGPYLREPGDKLIDSNEKGVSIVSPDGKELWQKGVKQFKLAKGGSAELLLHREHELDDQKYRVRASGDLARSGSELVHRRLCQVKCKEVPGSVNIETVGLKTAIYN